MFQQIVDGRTDLILDFLSAGNEPTTSDQHGTRIIRWCAYHGDVTAVKVLLDSGESLQALGENFDLNGAAYHGHWQLCQFLIEQGSEVNYRCPDTGESALHAALCKANRPIYDHVVEVLVAASANPNLPTNPNVVTRGFMRDCRTKGETPLHRAAAFGTEKAISLLLQAGADRNAKDVNGDSPLSWASWHLRPPAVLRALCYDGFSVHPENSSTYDHGIGWSQIDPSMSGRPHVDR